MARYRESDYHQVLLVPVALEEQLTPGTLEYAIHHIIEHRIDMGLFDARYTNDDTGRKAISPKILLKIVLFGYSRGLLSSRSLQRACQENITFMALACGLKPDHSTIAAFISSLGKEIQPLFTKILLICDEEGLLGGTHFSLDGLKLPSNAAKEWSGTFADLKKKQDALHKKVAQALQEHHAADKRAKSKGSTDSQRREKRIKRLQHKADRIEKFLAQNAPKTGETGKEIQSNVTDNESAKMATSHGVVQGYNAQAMVDEKHQVVLHAEALGKGNDSTAMQSMLAGAQARLLALGWEEPLKDRIISADTGYYSIKNLRACQELAVDAYVPDPHFRGRDVRFENASRHRRPVDKNKQKYASQKRFFGVEDFCLDEASGKLICPAGHALYVKNRNVVMRGGLQAVAYQAPKSACRGCALRAQCLRSQAAPARQVHVSYGARPGSITDAMKQKIDTPEGRRTYSKRLGIVEPVFANIRAAKKMDRFTLRGQLKVGIQWMLYCLVHNIEKIANYGSTYLMATA